LQFDGNNDFVTLQQTYYMLGEGWEDTMTIETWVNPLGEAENCNYFEVANCDPIIGDRPRWFGIYRGALAGLDRIWVWNYDGNYDVIGVTYTPGEWVHITMMHADGVLHAYKNGVEVGSLLSGTTQQPHTGALPVLQLGGIVNNATQNWIFEGQIDEVRFWNVARTPGEVQQDLDQTLAGDESGLKAYYQMSDGAGLTLTDDSQFNWNGTLHDGTTDLPPDGSPPQWVVSDAFGTVP
jgi:hypothetical protein